MTDQNTYNRQLIEEFRANRGKSGGPMEGRPLLLLTTTGAKSGQLRTTPIKKLSSKSVLQIHQHIDATFRFNSLTSASGGIPPRQVHLLSPMV